MDDYLSGFWAYPDQRMGRLLEALPRRTLEHDLQAVVDRFGRIGQDGYLTRQDQYDLMFLPVEFDELNITPAVSAQIDARNGKVKKRDAMGIYFLFAFLGFYDEAKARAVDEYTRIAQEKYPDANRAWVIERLAVPNTDGSLFEEEMQARAVYEAQRLSQMVSAAMLQGETPSIRAPLIQRFLRAEQGWLLKASEGGGYHGHLDTTMTNIVGYCVIEDMKRRGIETVEFVAILDGRTTKECRKLHGEVLKVSELVMGKNAPPIYPPPHPCRSALKPIRRRA